jgi:hypothetical protein
MDDLVALASDPAAWVALGTLIAMEVVLGIDNLLFISILTNKLPEHQRARARMIGIGAALILRLALLSLVFVIVQLTEPVVTLFSQDFSWPDIILIAGGLFLVWKATKEIHHNVDPDPGPDVFGGGSGAGTIGYAAAIGQILVLDLVFSVDSIITAVGMTEHVEIMVIAVRAGRCPLRRPLQIMRARAEKPIAPQPCRRYLGTRRWYKRRGRASLTPCPIYVFSVFGRLSPGAPAAARRFFQRATVAIAATRSHHGKAGERVVLSAPSPGRQE